MGNTKMQVSRLCFGSLTISPLQKGFSHNEADRLLKYAFSQGINCVDTAEYYENYPLLKEALKAYPEVILITKSYAYDRKGALASIERAQNMLQRKTIDVMMLHEQESYDTLRGHREALDTYLEFKENGIIRAVGVSTHFVPCAHTAARMPELDVLSLLLNEAAIGIMRGTREEMERELLTAHANGKGTIGMKALGGGHLLSRPKQALEYALSLPFDCIAVGMQSKAEVDCNCMAFSKTESTESLWEETTIAPRTLHIADWCSGCGNCVERCKQNALSLQNGRSTVDINRCVLCGYCAKVCPEFCIKVY